MLVYVATPLPELFSLVLKDFGIVYLLPLLKNLFLTGINLTRLDLHYLDSSPGISIEDIDYTCPLLEQLTICDSLITWTQDLYVHVASQGTKKSTHHTWQWFCKKHKNISCKEILVKSVSLIGQIPFAQSIMLNTFLTLLPYAKPNGFM